MRRITRIRYAIPQLAVSCVFLCSPDVALANGLFDLVPLVMSGNPAPGTSENVHFASFGRPTFNVAGQLAFEASLEGPGVDFDNDQGIWSGLPDDLNLLAREGEQAPGAKAHIRFSSFTRPALNEAGQIALDALLTSTDDEGNPDEGIWTDASGGLQLIAGTGKEASGTAGAQFASMGVPTFNDAAHVAFVGVLEGPGSTDDNEFGLWVGTAGDLQLVARDGEPAHGAPAGVNYRLRDFDVDLNDAGQFVYHTRLIGSAVDASNNSGLLTGTPDDPRLFVRAGQPAQDAEPGTLYDSFDGGSRINNAGHVAFAAFLSGDAVDASNNEGVWVGPPEALQLAVREGGHAPGTPTGVRFAGFYEDTLAFNDNGQLAFLADLAGATVDETNRTGIWVGTPDNMELVGRRGEAFSEDFNLSGFSHIAMNNRGQVAFVGATGDALFGKQTLWATFPSGNLEPIIAAGEEVDLGNGESKTVSGIELVTEPRNGYSAFTDNGRLAFQLSFTDNSSGIFMTVIPEPGTLGLSVTAILILLGGYHAWGRR